MVQVSSLLQLVLLVVLLRTSTASLATSPVDIQALQQIKASIDPSSIHQSSCLDTWDFRFDPCSSPSSASAFACGLRCDESDGHWRRVTSLLLDGHGYTGNLSPFIGNLSHLQSLDVSGNAFSGRLPRELGRLRRLRRLDAGGNRLSGDIPVELGTMASLESIGLAGNALTGAIPPAALSSLPRLRQISVQGNSLQGPLPSLRRLPSLRYVDASRNGLEGPLDPSSLPASLVRLSLRGNRLSGRLPSDLPPALEVLDVAGNHFTGAVPVALFLHPSLQQVNLASNELDQISEPPPLSMPALVLSSRLVAFDASSNRISGELPHFLVSLPRLSSLSLAQNAFHGLIPLEYALRAAAAAQQQQPLLARLYLQGNFLAGPLPPPLFNLGAAPPDRRPVAASLAANCLQSCPLAFFFCGAQRPATECRNIPR